MAKTSKVEKTDRKARIEALNKQQRGADKRQGLAIVVVCAVVAVLIVGAAAYRPVSQWWQLRAFSGDTLSDIGAAPSVCQDPTTAKADGNQEHVPDGTPVAYDTSPPAFGPHYDAPDAMTRKLYTADDRPDVRVLVHNLEHGYTLVWYDQSIAEDSQAMTELRAVASKFPGEENLRYKFKAVPWTDQDGEAFPGGAHIAYTHWSAGGVGDTKVADQLGVWQYCSAFSGSALTTFMDDYPYLDAPEPNGA